MNANRFDRISALLADRGTAPARAAVIAAAGVGPAAGAPERLTAGAACSGFDLRWSGGLTGADGACGAALVARYGAGPATADAECGGEASPRSSDDNGAYDDGPLDCALPAGGLVPAARRLLRSERLRRRRLRLNQR